VWDERVTQRKGGKIRDVIENKIKKEKKKKKLEDKGESISERVRFARW